MILLLASQSLLCSVQLYSHTAIQPYSKSHHYHLGEASLTVAALIPIVNRFQDSAKVASFSVGEVDAAHWKDSWQLVYLPG